MEERNQRMLTYAMAIAELIVNSENQKETLLAEKFEALKKSWSLLELYASEGFDEKILDAIMEKKSAMILDATSVKDIREISEPPTPYYTGNTYSTLERNDYTFWCDIDPNQRSTRANCDRVGQTLCSGNDLCGEHCG